MTMPAAVRSKVAFCCGARCMVLVNSVWTPTIDFSACWIWFISGVSAHTKAEVPLRVMKNRANIILDAENISTYYNLFIITAEV